MTRQRAYEPNTGKSKFTAERRAKLIEAFALGASVETAAALARITAVTLYRWLRKGEDAPEESRWHQFYLDVAEARAQPRERALAVIHDAIPDYPMLAFKYIERVEKGYAPPTVAGPPAGGTTVVQLSFGNGAPLALAGDTDIEVGESEEEGILVEPAKLAAPASS